MKNMKKFVAAFAAAAMVMSMGVSAFADVIAPGKVVDETTGDMTHITFFVDGEDISKNDEENQITLLAYLIPEINPATQQPYTAETIPAYVDQEIIAIDQVGGSAGFGTVPVETNKLANGKAIAVMLGGSDGTVAKGIITYNEETGEVEITLGDVTGDGAIDMGDAAAVFNHFMKYTLITDSNALKAADVTADGAIDMGDAAAIFNHFMKYTLIK